MRPGAGLCQPGYPDIGQRFTRRNPGGGMPVGRCRPAGPLQAQRCQRASKSSFHSVYSRSSWRVYFVLLHDDDRINSSFVSELVAVATRHPEANVVAPANLMIDEQGAIVKELTTPLIEAFDGTDFVCDWLDNSRPRWLANVTTVLFRTETVRRFGGFQSLGGGRNQDNLLFLQAAIAGRVGFAKRAVFAWRIYGNSYGAAATPRQIAQSGRDFLRHLRHHPQTVKELSRLPAKSRKRILRSVAEMSAMEVVFQMEALRLPFDRRSVSVLLAERRDMRFVYVVSREYLRGAFPKLHSLGRKLIRKGSTLQRSRVAEDSVDSRL